MVRIGKSQLHYTVDAGTSPQDTRFLRENWGGGQNLENFVSPSQVRIGESQLQLMLVPLARMQDSCGKVGVVDKVWEILCLKAECSVKVVGGALLARQPFVWQKVAYRF
jgi:hypothetical protein